MDISFNIRNKTTKAFIESTVRFFEQDLKLKNSQYKLDVYTKRGMSEDDGCRGSVTYVGPKYLIMLLDSKLDVERLVLTIAHEMVHVKQYARGQITHKPGGKTYYWMGKKVRKSYFNQPWELEAFGKERILANKIFQIINK
jgi:uncharacterized protein YjaZ